MPLTMRSYARVHARVQHSMRAQTALGGLSESVCNKIENARAFTTRRKEDPPEYSRLRTKCVQSGEAGGRIDLKDSLTTPIAQTATYSFRDSSQVKEYFMLNEHEKLDQYGDRNPTIKVCEDKLAALENGEDCLFSASGMNSCTTMLMALLPRGGHLITTKDCYRRTRQFVQTFLPRMQITCTVLDFDQHSLEDMERILIEEKPQIFFSESPTNPFLRCLDIAKMAEICKKSNTLLCIDSTFATPINQRPMEMGADLVLHSCTKYIGGHNDVLAGALVGSRELIGKVRSFHHTVGGLIDPHAAYLVLRGMKTLAVRVKQQNATALALAQYLSSRPEVERVFYPGLSSHPDYDIARRQMTGFGGVLSFSIKGGLQAAARFIDALRIPYIAPSLGGVESLVEQPTIISYWDKSVEERAEIGILDGLVRFSAGIEDKEDLMADFSRALGFIDDPNGPIYSLPDNTKREAL